MSVFINNGVNNGIEAYFKRKENNNFNSIHIFELFVIDVLVKIYDRINIINPYTTNYDKSFINNLKLYGLSSKDVADFLSAMDDYDNWLNSSTGSKTDAVERVYKVLIKMVLLKNLYKKIDLDELEYYDSFFNIKDDKLFKICKLSSNSLSNIISFWNRKKNIYFSNDEYIFDEIEADYLSNTMYEKHGINIDLVKRLSNLKVNEINNIIHDDEKVKKVNIFKITLTSGSGMVDSLILFSIVITEIFIGFLIAIVGR